MKKRIFLTISLVSLSTFTVKSAEAPSADKSPVNKAQFNLDPRLLLSLRDQSLNKEREIATLSTARYGFNPSPKKPNTCKHKVQAAASVTESSQGKSLSTVADRRKAKELRTASAAAADRSITPQETTYSLEMIDTGVTLEKDGTLALACFSIVDCQTKLSMIGADKITLVSDAGLCPCCGIIDNSKQIVHQYFPRKSKKILRIPPLKINDVSLDKNPAEWRFAVQTNPDFITCGFEQRAAAEKISSIFLLVREGTRNPILVAEALRTMYQYDWECTHIPGRISDDGKILPPTN